MPAQRERVDSDRMADTARLAGRSTTPDRDDSDPAPRGPSLTDREMTVLGLLIDGKRNQDISRELAISERTVKFHVSGLFAKLGVSSRTQVVALAQKQGLLEP